MFLEFLKYIVVMRFYDEYWCFYDEICYMCSVNYDFIGYLEIIEEDVLFFFNELGIDDYVIFKLGCCLYILFELLKYYLQIFVFYIKRLGKIYFKDFEMFGYLFFGFLKLIIGDLI